ncbi:MAG: hypothetical protein PHY54_11445 [Methylococcales bacterium]|nr:hypothetical protein [Methylococcales bacterium]
MINIPNHFTKSAPYMQCISEVTENDSYQLPVTFTIFRSSNSSLSKKYELDVEGNINKMSAANMSKGLALRKTIDFSDFPNELNLADHNTAFCLGVYNENYEESVRIVTADRVQFEDGAIARTREYFSYQQAPGILMLDYDPSIWGKRINSADQLIQILTTIDPSFSLVAFCTRGSLSAGVHMIDKLPESGQGFHLYIPVNNAFDIPRVGQILFKRLWLAGYGHIDISKSGSLLIRTIIDAAVFSPERLDFVGKPVVGPGLTWTRSDCIYHHGQYLDTASLADLSINEDQKCCRLIELAKKQASFEAQTASKHWHSQQVSKLVEKGVTLTQAEKQIQNLANGEKIVLPLDLILHFDKLGAETVRTVITNPSRFDKHSLADPFAPEKGPSKAKLWINGPDGIPIISSFIHGGIKYYLPSLFKELKPEIQIISGKKPAIVDECENVLISTGEIFVYAGLLVRLIKNHLIYSNTQLRIVPVEAVFLVEYLMTHAKFVKFNKQQHDWIDADLPLDYANTLLARKNWRLPNLTGIIHAPTIRTDGSILENAGYDLSTGLFVDLGNNNFPCIPQKPSHEDALLALDILKKPLSEFPFTHDSDLATVIAAILTALVRHSVDNAPLFLFDSPKQGSGKGLLANLVAQVAMGRGCAAMSYTGKQDEERKRLIALLIEGASIFCIDNIDHPLGGETLCTVLTMPELKDRLLGKTQTVSASTRATFLATGNNVSVVGDLTRRVLPCAIDPKVERPNERDFLIHLPTYVDRNRTELVHAALTIIKAYYVAGLPKQSLKAFGSFEQWSDLVRSAIVWLGLADPCLGLSRWDNVDYVRSELSFVLEEWHETLGSEVCTVQQLVKYAKLNRQTNLEQALIDVAEKQGEINHRCLGQWLIKYRDRIESGYKLEQWGKSGTRNKYRVVKV